MKYAMVCLEERRDRTLPNHEEKIASYKTLIELHYSNVEKAQWRLFELRTGSIATAGDEVAFSRSLIADEMSEIRKLEMLLKRLEHPKENDTTVLWRMLRLGGSFGWSRRIN
ncbi:hypothetical protein FHS21_000312 [Phyllobacterium trifolii]|uniref:Uncharacterized protein n=1 Tax=Phyllobacterium trifolii TaxID=300193 RepID=A0A839U6Z6_9HYPH|nr:hypothetical protein [Phyllobacterium trifolii]MBB3143929.1 hypothetical protein [Phyllobacterium trifolii]